MSVKDNIYSNGTNTNVPFKGTIEQAGSLVFRENLLGNSFPYLEFETSPQKQDTPNLLYGGMISQNIGKIQSKTTFFMFIVLIYSYIIYLINYKYIIYLIHYKLCTNILVI
jgi:hypothetical protein